MLSFSVQTGHEAIHFGAVNGHSHVVELLIDKYTVSPNATTEVLFSACRTTTLQSVSFHSMQDNFTPLLLAVVGGHEALVELLFTKYSQSLPNEEDLWKIL